MPNFNKSRGFKMSGYSYPGKSPMKGKKKKADQAAAKEGQAEAMAKMQEFGDMKMESTDILGKGSFKVDAGSSPATKRSPAKNWLGSMISSIGQAAASKTGKARASIRRYWQDKSLKNSKPKEKKICFVYRT